ncbi:hypothetical protein NBRC116602_03650 [Hyphomicrobiales bacterium 4NK60-0047b]
MILVGNQRGNYKDMANHLLKDDNEQVTLHEIKGFMGETLHTALQESYAVSRATKCSKHLYSLSFSPPKDACLDTKQFEDAINRAEKRLGLTGQPRVIVFHEKRGRDGELRKHAHAVWCRIDAENGKAIHIAYDHTKLNVFSRELFLENGWALPKGYKNRADRDPLNYTHAQHQQARRAGKQADEIKRQFQSAWAQSDTRKTFATALKEVGYILARGDRRGFVAVDSLGEVYSVARYVGIKTRDVRDRLGELEGLPSVEQAQEIALRDCPAPHKTFEDSPLTRKIKQNPEHVLSLLTEKEASFTRHSIAKTLNSYIDDPQDYQAAYQRVMASKALVQLTPGTDNPKLKTRYSTREMIDLEITLMSNANDMAQSGGFKVSGRNQEIAINTTNKALQNKGVSLSEEQRQAIRHVTDDKQLSSVIGVAGAGKSTILAAARDAWEAEGRRVFGAALAGKAAKGLEQSSGIQSKTLASYELGWEHERNQLQKGDVFVIDEAGMIGSKQMARFITEVKNKGAKLVLVGDAEQLQPIEAGAPFRCITKDNKPATLHDVHRQKDDWQKQASQDFALSKTQDALKAYQDHGRIDKSETQDDAIQGLVSDYLNDFWSCEGRASQIALAHRKADVKSINDMIREARKEAGELEDGITYQTTHGKREFAPGDRLLFTRNHRETGLKNGMLGTVTNTAEHCLTIALDEKQESDQPNEMTISIKDYQDIEHGYATTIHKSQGATVDKSYVLASQTMDRHLTYVAMTRHKQETRLYASNEEFSSNEKMVNTLSRARHKLMAIEHETQQQEPTECLEQQENASQDKEIRQQEVMDYLRQSRENGWKYER